MEEFKEIIEYIYAHREIGHSVKETLKLLEESYLSILEGDYPETYLGFQLDDTRKTIGITYIDKEENIMLKGTVMFKEYEE